MKFEANAESEALERFSRRALATALIVTLLLGLIAVSTLAGASKPRLVVALLPVAIAVAVASLGRRRGLDKARRAIQEVNFAREA